MTGCLIALFLLLIAPVQVGAALRWEGGFPRLLVGVMIWGLRVQTAISFSRDPAGHLLLNADFAGKPRPLPLHRSKGGHGLQALGLLLRSNERDRLLKDGIQIKTLDIFLQVGGPNAAFTALLTGALRALNPLLPRARIVCRPAFQGTTRLLARCIAQTRLGMLWIAWPRWRLRQKSRKKEETAWSIPSET